MRARIDESALCELLLERVHGVASAQHDCSCQIKASPYVRSPLPPPLYQTAISKAKAYILARPAWTEATRQKLIISKEASLFMPNRNRPGYRCTARKSSSAVLLPRRGGVPAAVVSAGKRKICPMSQMVSYCRYSNSIPSL